MALEDSVSYPLNNLAVSNTKFSTGVLPTIPNMTQIISLSTRFLSSRICGIRSEDSFVVTDAAITDRETPQARPRAVFDGM